MDPVRLHTAAARPEGRDARSEYKAKMSEAFKHRLAELLVHF